MSARVRTSADVCLVTVTTPSFVPGTLVLLDSFLRLNPWFDGGVTVVQDGLTPAERRLIAAVYARLEFLDVSPELAASIDAAVAIVPDLAPRRARFLSLEAFRPRGYRRVLFCDSDLLFRGSIGDLFATPHALVACGDGYHYRGRPRRWTLPASLTGCGPRTVSYSQTFNAGMLLIDGSLTTASQYDDLLGVVASGIHRSDGVGLTDQVVLNVCFAGRQQLVGAEYNYLLRHHDAIVQQGGVDLASARVVHYNGEPKPWQTGRVGQGSPASVHARAARWWAEAYGAYRRRLHLAAAPADYPGGR